MVLELNAAFHDSVSFFIFLIMLNWLRKTDMVDAENIRGTLDLDLKESTITLRPALGKYGKQNGNLDEEIGLWIKSCLESLQEVMALEVCSQNCISG